MKKVTIKILLLALPAFLIMSCRPALEVRTDYDRSADFSAYKTFSMYYLATSRNINELNEERLWNSIRNEMIKKGYREDNTDPDLLVNAISVLEDKKLLSANSTYYGYGGVYRPYSYWRAPGNATVHAYDYKKGSLMIDVVDTKTKKLVWEGSGTAEMEKQPKNPDEAIRKTVNKIMSGLPGADIK